VSTGKTNLEAPSGDLPGVANLRKLETGGPPGAARQRSLAVRLSIVGKDIADPGPGIRCRGKPVAEEVVVPASRRGVAAVLKDLILAVVVRVAGHVPVRYGGHGMWKEGSGRNGKEGGWLHLSVVFGRDENGWMRVVVSLKVLWSPWSVLIILHANEECRTFSRVVEGLLHEEFC